MELKAITAYLNRLKKKKKIFEWAYHIEAKEYCIRVYFIDDFIFGHKVYFSSSEVKNTGEIDKKIGIREKK